MVFTQVDDGQLRGSARSIAGFHIRDALGVIATDHPGLLTRFGGHAMAAGLTLAEVDFRLFKTAFEQQAKEKLNSTDLAAHIVSDGPLTVSEMGLDTARLLRNAGPWGQAFPEPVFDGEFVVLQQRIVGEKHLKLVVSDPDSGHIVDAIAFNVDLTLLPITTERVLLAYQLDVNEFRGETSVQLKVSYLQPVD